MASQTSTDIKRKCLKDIISQSTNRTTNSSYSDDDYHKSNKLVQWLQKFKFIHSNKRNYSGAPIDMLCDYPISIRKSKSNVHRFTNSSGHRNGCQRMTRRFSDEDESTATIQDSIHRSFYAASERSDNDANTGNGVLHRSDNEPLDLISVVSSVSSSTSNSTNSYYNGIFSFYERQNSSTTDSSTDVTTCHEYCYTASESDTDSEIQSEFQSD
ncbi:unnamed protein product [Ambrosiozyma monospora]|uniref:Unnamed protein product n=1 Tax=Ambrosiozyma monospora TaxID=43982 RepID=A0A9W7DEQ3_AMBMO|nr:unnamed protein product [Ambrosiozyma monospora]